MDMSKEGRHDDHILLYIPRETQLMYYGRVCNIVRNTEEGCNRQTHSSCLNTRETLNLLRRFALHSQRVLIDALSF